MTYLHRNQKKEEGGVIRISICTSSDLEKKFLACLSEKNKPLLKPKNSKQLSNGAISQLDLWNNDYLENN